MHSFTDDSILVEDGSTKKNTLLLRFESGPSTFGLRMVLRTIVLSYGEWSCIHLQDGLADRNTLLVESGRSTYQLRMVLRTIVLSYVEWSCIHLWMRCAFCCRRQYPLWGWSYGQEHSLVESGPSTYQLRMVLQIIVLSYGQWCCIHLWMSSCIQYQIWCGLRWHQRWCCSRWC